MDKLVSIIVPLYNDHDYIDKCINSILNQTYKNIEIIAINDGSTDDTLQKIENIAEKDIRIKVISQSNQGVSTSRNNGLKLCNGEYVCFVDQDDFLDKNFIEYMVNLIESNNAEIATTPMPYKYNGTEIKKNNEEDKVKIISGEEAVINMLYYKFFIAPWNKLISKKIIDDYNIQFNTELFGGEGFAFSIECFQRANKVAVGNRKYYYYRVNNPNSGMTKFKMPVIESSIKAQEYIKKQIIFDDKRMQDALDYGKWHTYTDCLNEFIGCEVEKKYKKEYKKIEEYCHKNAKKSMKAPVSKKEKIKIFLYAISPNMAAKVINKFRKRKFTKEI